MKLWHNFFWHVCFLFSLSAVSNDVLIEHVKKSIANAQAGTSKLPEDISTTLEGLSSRKIRYLLNWLCALTDAHYLEIGAWKGSTFISALYKNDDTTAVAIDNFSEDYYWEGRAEEWRTWWVSRCPCGLKNDFLGNVNQYLGKRAFKLFDVDCFSIDIKTAFDHPINVYFYDANHSCEAHKKAFTYFDPVFAGNFIAIIHGWNSDCVKSGTREAFNELGYKILYEVEIPSTPVEFLILGEKDDGLYVAVINKGSEVSKRQ